MKQYALEHNLPLLQPEKLKDEAFVEALRAWKADLQIVVAFRMFMTIMTPIAPHTLNTRSIIFPAQDVITVEIGKGRHCDCEKGIASFDGDTFIPMVTGDCIQIRQADVKTKILKLNHLSFVEVLRRKMRDS